MSNVGQFVWYDLATKDLEAAKAFYAHVVGWKAEPFKNTPYTMFVSSQGGIGGVSQHEDPKTPPSWTGSVEVADLDAAVAKVTAKGGKVLMPPMDIPGDGRFSVVADPQGAVISLYATKAGGTAHDTNRDGEFSWHELYTSDVEKAVAFYTDLLGWERLRDHDMGDMGPYVLFGKGGKELGGMMRMPPGLPHPVWGYYITMSDFDAALERAKEKGAKVLMGPMDVPGNQRVVQLLDPQGAAFALVTPRPAS